LRDIAVTDKLTNHQLLKLSGDILLKEWKIELPKRGLSTLIELKLLEKIEKLRTQESQTNSKLPGG